MLINAMPGNTQRVPTNNSSVDPEVELVKNEFAGTEVKDGNVVVGARLLPTAPQITPKTIDAAAALIMTMD